MFKEVIAELIAKKVSVSREQILRLIEVPPKPEFGDYSFPCFSLAGKLKKAPAEIAQELGKIKLPKEIKEIKVVGAYINFFVNKEILASSVVDEILKQKNNYGMNEHGKGKRVMVEYSSPNTNKPMHLGHLKNNSIGMAISNILEFSGYKVIKANLLNDRGAHICKVMYAYEKLSKQKEPGKQKPDHFAGDLYVLYAKKENEKMKEEILKMLQKWENKDKKTRALWEKINKWVIKGLKETYKNFGSEFDVLFKESQFYKKAKDIIKEGLKKKVFFKNEEGAIFAKLDPLPDKIILRKDGTSLYVTNDLALTRHKFDKFKLDESIWVTGSEQKLYFEQLFRIFFLLGFKWYNQCKHVPYGMVLLESGKMKSREGTVVDADDMIAEITELARKEILQREKVNKNELERRAIAIALAAIKFYLLRVDPDKDTLFHPQKAVSFEGYTGPYLQYAHARASNILKKAEKGKKQGKADYSLLKMPEELELISKLNEFSEIVKSSSNKLSPALIANYAYQLCQLFANFYEKCQVINADKERDARIALVKAFKQVLENSLKLLDIEPLERM